MKPMRKPFRLDPIFPFEIVFEQLRTTRNELPDHLHDLYELVYIHRGNGTIFIDNALYEQKPGDLFLIPGNTIHRAFSNAAEPVVSTAVFFAPAFIRSEWVDDGYAPLKGFDIARHKGRYKLSLPDELQQRFQSVLSDIDRETKSKEVGYRHAVRMQLQRLLLWVNRIPAARDPDSNANTRIGPHWMLDAMREIDRDPVQAGGLAELSAKAGVTAPHFSRVFKQFTGMNLIDYVTVKRIVRVKSLLLASDDNVEAIALECGFQSLPHFYLTFKKLTGMTPRAYRNSYLEP
ncbi:helix-turn-helix domain-containing protein [Cohnella yongneupensis]|uniref:Helix-turn-helix domain-containing protein n=1 Tax=Cohnella yongneupensis TaxID=425006 RepID=A0ABW0R042_9BACL